MDQNQHQRGKLWEAKNEDKRQLPLSHPLAGRALTGDSEQPFRPPPNRMQPQRHPDLEIAQGLRIAVTATGVDRNDPGNMRILMPIDVTTGIPVLATNRLKTAKALKDPMQKMARYETESADLMTAMVIALTVTRRDELEVVHQKVPIGGTIVPAEQGVITNL